MRIGSEYLTSNTAIAFPFRDDQDIPVEVRRSIVDARIVSEYEDPGSALPSFTGLTKSGYVVTATVFASGDTVTLESNLSSVPSGFNVVRNGNVCLVFDNTYLSSASPNFSGSLEFDVKCLDIDVKKVTSLVLVKRTVSGGVIQDETTSVTGDITVSNGYSTTVTSNDGVVINAVPGAGKGYYPCPCQDVTSETDTDDQSFKLYTKAGIIKIQNDSCYDLVPDITDAYVDGYRSNYIYFINKCVACCTCQQYIDKVGRLRQLATTVHGLGEGIIGAINAHNGKVANFNSNLSPGHGGVEPAWYATITALKKNPSVGSIHGKLHVRAVATISNITLKTGRLTVSQFDCEDEGGGTTVDYDDIHWFMLGNQNNSGTSLPDDLEVGPGKTVKITGTCTLPGSTNSLVSTVAGSADVSGQTYNVEAHTVC